MPQQFENPANVEVHRRTTAQEILRDFADKPLDALITGVGTGGHITGCAEVLKTQWPDLKVFAVEPTLSPVISGGQPGPHPIQGIGAGFIPAIMDTSAARRRDPGRADDAKEMARRAAREEGHARRHFLGRDAGGDRAEAARAWRPAARARLQLRHRRTISVGAGLPSRRSLSAPLTLFLRCAVNSGSVKQTLSARTTPQGLPVRTINAQIAVC